MRVEWVEAEIKRGDSDNLCCANHRLSAFPMQWCGAKDSALATLLHAPFNQIGAEASMQTALMHALHSD